MRLWLGRGCLGRGLDGIERGRPALTHGLALVGVGQPFVMDAEGDAGFGRGDAQLQGGVVLPAGGLPLRAQQAAGFMGADVEAGAVGGGGGVAFFVGGGGVEADSGEQQVPRQVGGEGQGAADAELPALGLSLAGGGWCHGGSAVGSRWLQRDLFDKVIISILWHSASVNWTITGGKIIILHECRNDGA